MSKTMRGIDFISLGILLVLLTISFDAASCTLSIPFDVYLEANLEKSRWLWLASGLVGLLVSVVHFSRTRRMTVPSIVAVLVVFHPAWTVSPMHGPDCVSMSVWMSQAVVVILVVLLAIEFMKTVLNGKEDIPNHHDT